MSGFVFLTMYLGLAAATTAAERPASPIMVVGKPINRDLFRPVGLVVLRHRVGEEQARTFGTAFLISDCHALTARRIFEDDRAVTGRWVEYWADVKGDVKQWKGSIAQVVAEGTADPANAVTTNDWVLLKLEQCLGREHGTVALSRAKPNRALAYILASFTADGGFARGVNINRRCRFSATTAALARHSCTTKLGEAGSPIVQVVDEGGRQRLSLVGMLSTAASPPAARRGSLERNPNMQHAEVAILARSLVANPAIAWAARKRF
jgi:hypothetical protein